MKIEQIIVPRIATALPGGRVNWVVVWWLVGVVIGVGILVVEASGKGKTEHKSL